jgi:RNA polymerase sigma factor (sigma-70 family)
MSPGIPTRLLATQSDERLLTLVRQGHERAFEALVHRYRRPLLGYCRRLRLTEVRAEDIVQLALLKTWIAVREGAEVRDLKAWLYRVVHNTAVNALRDAAHDGEPLADFESGSGSRTPVEEPQLDSGLTMREALTQVAALPPLQREVIVRTAVAGHSHEQVASDLGITDGAVRGLLYRARVTLRTAVTALTPPQLLGWLAGRADQGGPAPERLTELAGGGGAAGLGGLLLKGGVVAITAGTVITGAAVVHLSASNHHGHRRGLIVAANPASAGAVGGASSSSAAAEAAARYRGTAVAGSRTRRRARASDPHHGERSGARVDAATGGGSTSGSVTAPSGHDVPQSTARVRSNTQGGSPTSGETVQITVTPPSSPSSSQAQESGQGGGSDAGSGGPVGSAAGDGSGSGTGTGGSAGQGSAEGGGAPSGDQPGGDQSGSGSDTGSGSGTESGSGSGSGSGGSEGAGDQGSSSEASGSESSGGSSDEQSGSLVGTVVHEVGSVLEHVLH